MITNRWHMHRMGLIDFWYYYNEEFYFKNGHMLLRGSNGSGKSVTLQSIIPLLLDGNKSSERLDSFGTRARKMETYLIDEDSDRNDRIGYLYLEFKKEDADLYKTIGMGLRARKNKPLESWYFVIEDNRRINKDIFLMSNNLAIAKSTLKSLIKDQLIESQKEYMDRVNQALFHFANREEYKEAVNLLVQLRSPKLSNSLKPTMINEILSRSLQPLSEEDLRPMTEALSNMDDIQDQLEILRAGYKSASSILKVYDQYNCAILLKKAQNSMEAQRLLKEEKQKQKNYLVEQETNKNSLEYAIQKKADLQQEYKDLQNEHNSLLKDDIVQLTQDLEVNRENHHEKQIQLQRKKQQEVEKENAYFDEKQRYEKIKNTCQKQELKIQEVFQEMEELQENLQFEEQIALKKDFLPYLQQEYDFTYTLNKVKEEIEYLTKAETLFSEIDQEKRILLRLSEEKERRQQDFEDAERKLEKLETKFFEEVEVYKEKVLKWHKSNSVLFLSHEQILEILSLIQDGFKETKNERIESIIQDVYQNYFKRLSKDLIENQHEQKSIIQVVYELEQELNHWKSVKDPQPDEDLAVQKCRTYLKENKIHFKPLYTFLEYDESITQIQKDVFEEQLLRMGILNSVVVGKENKDKIVSMSKGMADQFLFVDQPIDNYGICFLHNQKGYIDFEQVLHHFGWDVEAVNVSFSTYYYGLSMGTIAQDRQAIYIGKESREKYRQEKIQSLLEEVGKQKKLLSSYKHQEDDLHDKIQKLENEKNSYPVKDQLNAIVRMIDKIELERETVLEQINKLKEEIDVCKQNVTQLQFSLSKICDRLGIAMVKEIIEERKSNFEIYRSCAADLKENHVRYVSNYEILQMTQSRLEDFSQDLMLIRQETNQISKEIQTLHSLIESIQKQMKELGYQDIQKRLTEIQERHAQILNEISVQDQKIGDLNQKDIQLKKLISDMMEKMNTLQFQYDTIENSFYKERDLGYVLSDAVDEKETIEVIDKKYPNLKNKEILQTELQNAFHNNKGQLQEYGLVIHNIFEDIETDTRMDIQTRYKGKNISFMELIENLQSDIEQQKLLLEESDRNLIEDILVNTIAKKIRTHIQSSKRWVEQMNRYMRAMNTSSGLKLSLKWHSHKAEDEEQLSTEQLVHLLEKDVQVLKEQDFTKLSSHFRSKLKMARKIADDEATIKSFHQVMREVLDYRTWFDFQIEYEKQGERKREMTNTAFFTFSGGEKAMAMYVPLFSAVAAKYEQASQDAPMLIALDEAFAGVDENNIENMFSLIQKFNFDYIMNSQVLWGDYSSVSSLAIHELFRPENAHYVTVISYEWNGKQKRMIA